MFRPEAASLSAKEGSLHYVLPVASVHYLGNGYELTLPCQDVIWTLRRREKINIGEKLSIYIDPKEVITFKKKEGLPA